MTEVLNKMTNCQRMTQKRLLAEDERHGCNSQLRPDKVIHNILISILLNKHKKIDKTFLECAEGDTWTWNICNTHVQDAIIIENRLKSRQIV